MAFKRQSAASARRPARARGKARSSVRFRPGDAAVRGDGANAARRRRDQPLYEALIIG